MKKYWRWGLPPGPWARGRLPSRYVIVEAAPYFRLKNPDDLNDMMLVQTGEMVDIKGPLAGKSGQRA